MWLWKSDNMLHAMCTKDLAKWNKAIRHVQATLYISECGRVVHDQRWQIDIIMTGQNMTWFHADKINHVPKFVDWNTCKTNKAFIDPIDQACNICIVYQNWTELAVLRFSKMQTWTRKALGASRVLYNFQHRQLPQT